MNDIIKKLESFRDDFKMSRKELLYFMNNLPEDKQSFMRSNEIIISAEHVIKLLEFFRDKKIDQDFLLDWVNTVWFTDWYHCDEKYTDSLPEVMDILEELDEHDRGLSNEQIIAFIDSLKTNIPLSEKYHSDWYR